MDLKQFKEEKDLTLQGLADFLGLNVTKVHRICSGVGCIKLQDAHVIATRTEGQVSYEDLLEAQEAC